MDQKIIAYVEEEIFDLVPGYLENRRKELPLLEDAIQRGDFPALRTAGHKLKGVAESYGFPQLTLIGKALESAAEKADAAEVKSLVAKIGDFLSRVEVKLKDGA